MIASCLAENEFGRPSVGHGRPRDERIADGPKVRSGTATNATPLQAR